MSIRKKMRDFFSKAWDWIQALWKRHDDHLEEMVKAILPMVISVAFRHDLSSKDKRDVILDAIIDNAEAEASEISSGIIGEAIEIAANKYNIQIGKTTIENMDASLAAAQKAARDFADKKLNLTGTEAEDAGLGTEE